MQKLKPRKMLGVSHDVNPEMAITNLELTSSRIISLLPEQLY